MTVAYQSGQGFIDGAATSSIATGAQSPVAGNLFIAFVVSSISGGAPAAPTVSADFSAGAVWTNTFDFAYQTSGANDSRMTVHRCLIPAGAGSQAITASWAGVNQTSCHLRVVSVTGHAVTGTNASDAFPHAAGTATGTAVSGTVTIPVYQDGNSLSFGFYCHNVNEGSTPGTGFTADNNSFNTPPVSGTEYGKNGTTVAASWPTSSAFGFMGFEVAGIVQSSWPFKPAPILKGP